MSTSRLLEISHQLSLEDGEEPKVVLGPGSIDGEAGVLLFATDRRMIWVQPASQPSPSPKVVKEMPIHNVETISIRLADEHLPSPDDVHLYFIVNVQDRFAFRAADCYGFVRVGYTPSWINPILARSIIVHWKIWSEKQQGVDAGEWAKARVRKMEARLLTAEGEAWVGDFKGMIRPERQGQFVYGGVEVTSKKLAFSIMGRTKLIGVKMHGEELVEFEDSKELFEVLKILPLEDLTTKLDGRLIVFNGESALQPLYYSQTAIDQFVKVVRERSGVQEARPPPWFEEALTLPSPMADGPLRIPIQDVFTITNVGTVPVGRIETGRIRVGEKVSIMPERLTAEVKSIETHHTMVKEATAGANIGFSLKGVAKGDFHKGSVVGPASSPPKVANEVVAQVAVLRPGLEINAKSFDFLIHTAKVTASISWVGQSLDPEGNPTTGPPALSPGGSSIVKIRLSQPVALETFSDSPTMGRFALRQGEATLAVGIVNSLSAIPSAIVSEPTKQSLSRVCGSCRAMNERDAVFCGRCGTRLG